MEEVARLVHGMLSISVVSHRQMVLIAGLLQDIQEHCGCLNIELILTLNLDEELDLPKKDFSFPIKVIKNLAPKGFGANHNQAFRHADGAFFCIVNPDIRFTSNPFPSLFTKLGSSPSSGVVAPVVVGPFGQLEDSVRLFPTPSMILAKAFGFLGVPDYSKDPNKTDVDWVGGMFMLFPRQVYEQLHGFDERYFMYYEDVDLCARLRLAGYRILVCPDSRVVHHAQRSSHRNLKYLRWHLASMCRYFLSPVYRQLKT